ncbi:MAG TPA: hypothetical protein PLT82_06880 [Candidatus Hydrogenedens sp.]|nr:hypothetical protein [Candidatus Hydrogenedens sp.]HOL20810.1 hypothetical protein [Candidatus Hydrogenedens sp.]HPP58842.1 hypothetical protein [Candidatus Hydrogenedens sp.]
MFSSKKKGLRSFRSVLILLIVILVLPLIILFIVKEYFAAPPICFEYDNIIRRTRSSENGYVYYVAANNLAERLTRGYFRTMKWKQFISDITDKYVLEQMDSKDIIMDVVEYLRYYKLLVSEKCILGEFDSYSKHTDWFNIPANPNPQGKSIGEIAKQIGGIAIYPEHNWKEDLLQHSHSVLDNIKKANQSKYVIPYFVMKEGKFINLFDYEILLIELANILIYLEQGDYDSALEWIQGFHYLIYRLGVYSIDNQVSLQFLYVVDTILSYPGLPDSFYNDLLCLLIETKESVKSIDFRSVYLRYIFELESAFVSYNEGLTDQNPINGIQNSFKVFFAYTNTARLLEKYGKTFEASTWEDVEKAVLYKQGKMSEAIEEIRMNNAKYNLYHFHWLFNSGELWESILRQRNTVLSAIYGSIIKVLLEKYRINNGNYPASLNDVVGSYLSDEEIKWILTYLEIQLSQWKYYIDYYPFPKLQSTPDKRTPNRDAYRIRTSN